MLIISLLESLLIEEFGNYFKGIYGKWKLKRFSKKLKKEIEFSILNQYGNTMYYHDFESFLIEQDVINKIIKNFLNQTLLESKTINQAVDFYLNFFIEKFPKYSIYKNDLKQVMQKYFYIIFQQLTPIDTPESKQLCRIIKEINYSIEKQLLYINNIVDENNTMLKNLLNGTFNTSSYLKVMLEKASTSYNQSVYFDRSVYQDSIYANEQDSLATLLKKHKIILVGEAGYGKTLESYRIISELCIKFSHYHLIPVYVPLFEYELNSDSLFKIIQTKLEHFCEGNAEKTIKDLFINNKVALFFDGIDDISDERKKTKFYSESIQLMNRYSSNYFFFTTRKNCYNHELGEESTFYLSCLSDDKIQRDLIKIGKYHNLPKSYVELFRNPFLFKIGKSIMSENVNKDLFNRTQIFTTYFENNYRKKKYESELSYYDTLNLFGKFSYEYFEKSSFTFSELDKIMSSYQNFSVNKRNMIDYFINFGIFDISEKISFSHKLFKEFCAAFYIINNFDIDSDNELLNKLCSDEIWREVVIFMSGLFSRIEKQDTFLDYFLKHNFPLYIECVNSKNDLLKSNENQESCSDNLLKRILSQILKSYKFVIENYFCSISEHFEPFIDEKLKLEHKISITGGIIEDNLFYWFDIVDFNASDVKIVSSKMIYQTSKEYQTNILKKTKRMIQRVINLESSGLVGDSGRKIAINILKENLRSILDNRLLIESNFILCERLKNVKNHLDCIKEIDEISLMRNVIRERLELITNNLPNNLPKAEIIKTSSGIDLFKLDNLLSTLKISGIDYNSSIIPSYDKDFSEANGLIMNLYSKERKLDIVEKFFNFAELSYLEMVKYNFPNIYKNFSKIQDMPYKLIVSYIHDERDPLIDYYHVANSDKENTVKVSIKESRKDYKIILNEIFQSYHSLNRTPKNVTLHHIGFSNLIFPIKGNENAQLSDFVYREIERSLEEIFGKF